MLQPNFTEEEIAHIYQLFMEHPSETVKKIACCLFESAAIASSRIVRIARVSGDSVTRYLQAYIEVV